MSMKTFELTEDEASLLTLALGMALGVCSRTGNKNLSNDLLRLANSVHRNNPNWRPYEVEEATKQGGSR